MGTGVLGVRGPLIGSSSCFSFLRADLSLPYLRPSKKDKAPPQVCPVVIFISGAACTYACAQLCLQGG